MSQAHESFSYGSLKTWLIDTVLPFWAAAGFDSRHGAFVEKLDLSGEPSRDDYTRVRVQARQIYVYAHAAHLGLYPQGLDLAREAWGFLDRHAWDRAEGGWFHRLHRNGGLLDRTKDCYDHAFVLLALAWLYRAGGDAAVLERARETVAYLDACLRLERNGGFDGYAERARAAGEELPLPRRQNPHMHLFEALLALYEATEEPEWLARAEAIHGLFEARFHDADTGQLIEFFDRDWNEVTVDGTLIREPGHHFEWVWLLHRYGQLSGSDAVLPTMQRLFAWGWEQGIDRGPEGPFAAYDAADPAGRILQGGSKRLWPQTEALKACLALAERRASAEAEAGIDALLRGMFAGFVSFDHALWQDQLDGAGRMIAPAIPASSLYHLFLAMAETLRVMPNRARVGAGLA